MVTAQQELAIELAIMSTEKLNALLEEKLDAVNHCFYYAKASVQGYDFVEQVHQCRAARQVYCDSKEIFTPVERLLLHDIARGTEVVHKAIKYELARREILVMMS